MRINSAAAVAVIVAIFASGCGTSSIPSSEKRIRTISPEYEQYLRNTTVRQLMDDIRDNKHPDETVGRDCVRWEVNELQLRGLPVFLEVTDFFLDENEDVRDAAWCVIAEVSRTPCGFARGSGWTEEKEKEWQALWLQGPLNGSAAKTAEERQALVKKWKQWYADNVERKGKL